MDTSSFQYDVSVGTAGPTKIGRHSAAGAVTLRWLALFTSLASVLVCVGAWANAVRQRPELASSASPRPIVAQSSDDSSEATQSSESTQADGVTSPAPQSGDARPRVLIPRERLRLHEEAIDRGIQYLTLPLRRGDSDGSLSKRYPVAVTALGGMALLGAGVEYNRGPHGAYLVQALEYLLDRRRRDEIGFINDGNSSTPSRMHGHAYAILFLAQIVGCIPLQSKNDQVRQVVRQGLDVIESAQTVDGGWGYLPRKFRDQDEGSITVCCLQALRAAKDAGFEVNPQVIQKAVSYLRASAKADGSFKYSLKGSSKSTYELTAAAVSTLDATGNYTGPVHRRGVEFMDAQVRKNPRNPLKASSRYPYYGNLYAAQVYFQIGDERWARWAELAYPRLLEKQQPDGSWENDQYGNAYATAVALLILEIPLGYLPIFER